MKFYRVPPVHSPLSEDALGRGLRTMLSAAAWQSARHDADHWVDEHFHPIAWAWTDSGTTALSLAIELAASRDDRRRIALPAYGCFDLATACDGAGVEVILYDLDPFTLGPAWGSLEQALQSGASGVVVVHQYGVPVDLDHVRRMATPHGAIVIEDAAQGIGGSYHRAPLGSHGDLSILSFGRGKGFSAGGGGLLMTRDPQFLDSVRGLELKGGRGAGAWAKSVVQALLSAPSRYWIPAALPMLGLGETTYHKAGGRAGLTRSGMGLLAGGSAGLEPAAAARRAVAAKWEELIPPAWRIRPEGSAGRPGFLRYPILLPNAECARLLGQSGARFGIGPSYPVSLHDLSGFGARTIRTDAGEDAGARILVTRLRTLPTHLYVNTIVMTAVSDLIRRLPAVAPVG